MLRQTAALLLSALLAAGQQPASLSVTPPEGRWGLRSYRPTELAPIRRANSPRLAQLVRAGKLYLTAQDAVALAIENNLDLELARYGPLQSEWQLRRAEAGGPLRGIPSGSAQIGQVASGQGVSGSQASAGVGGGGGGGGSSSGGGASISQIGPVTANLDPVVQNSTVFSHTTYPQVNTVQSQTAALVDSVRLYNTSIQQGLLTGGYAQISFRESYLKENTPTNILNPSVAPRLYFYLQHNLLNGFGRDVNSRFIRVAGRNLLAARESFRSQLIDLTAAVLNVYYGLVIDHETLTARQRAVDVADKFFRDTSEEIRIGARSRADIYRAELEVSSRRRDIADARQSVRQRENQLKNLISRIGMEDPLLDTIEIVPVDSVTVPPSTVLPPLREMVETAKANRPDILSSEIRLENQRINALGTQSGLLPQLVGIAQVYNSGLAGESQPYRGIAPNDYFVGGLGTALGQIFRRNFPNERAGVYVQGRFGNRISQGDYGIDQLELRKAELSALRDGNAMVVDISNQRVALQQAQARFAAAVATRALQQELLTKKQFMFRLGSVTLNEVIAAQRSLVTAESSEIAAKGAYSRARVGLDQITGLTLETNRISLVDALNR